MTDPSPDPFWIALLPAEERQAWRQGRLDADARNLGISGWLVPQDVTAAGTLEELLMPGVGDLPAAPLLQLREPLTPMAEQQLVKQLRPWWRQPQALRLFGRPLLLLQGAEHLSHRQFSLQRLRWLAFDLLLLSCDRGDVLEQIEQGFDGQVQDLEAGSRQQPPLYLQQLRSAHHSMEPRGLWIPAVQALTPAMELGWRAGCAEAYKEWLPQATAWSRLRFLGEAEAPVVIASWQGHQRWWPGESAASSQVASAAEPAASGAEATQRRCWGTPQSEHVALMIHGYYLEKLAVMVHRLPAGGHQGGIPGLDLYVSTPFEQLDEAEALLRSQGWPRVHLVGVANRGRDIAPFLLELLPAALQQGHRAFVKLHTKASPHLQKGDDWGQHLVDALLDFQLLGELPQRLQHDPCLGLLTPAGTLLPMSVALQANALHLQGFLQAQGWSGQWALQQRFAAGSMVCGRLQALQPLLNLGLSLKRFEPEAGQTDGTLAHALERWISLVILEQELRIDVLPGKTKAVPRFGYGWLEATVA
ncbi:MAG: rhamnan synthesis F family protein [Synechococcus sp.]|nr:rhamnan synthesis F family protein [Synechococcus sp.]